MTPFFLLNSGDDWQMHHYTIRYRTLQRHTLSEALEAAGFKGITWLIPEETDEGEIPPRLEFG